MAIKTFNFYDVAVGSYGKLDEGVAPTSAATLTKGSGSINANTFGEGASSAQYGATVTITDSVLGSAAVPNGSNGFRSLNTLSGTFAAGTWQVAIECSSNSIASSTYTFFWRIFKSVNADGSGATEITSGTETGTSSACTGSAVTQTSSQASRPAVTFTNEYLFVTLAIDISTARTVATTITPTLRVGASAVTTPDFTLSSTTSTQRTAGASTLTLESTQRVAGLSSLEAITTQRVAAVSTLWAIVGQTTITATAMAAALGARGSKDIPGQTTLSSTSQRASLGAVIWDYSISESSLTSEGLSGIITDVTTIPDTAAASESVISRVSIAYAMADGSVGTDTEASPVAATYAMPDTGVGSEQVSSPTIRVATVPDTGAGSEVVTPAQVATISIPDTGAGSEVMTAAAGRAAPVSDSASSIDAVIAVSGINYSLVDVASGVDVANIRAGQSLLPAVFAPTLATRNSLDRSGQSTLPFNIITAQLGSVVADYSIIDIASETDSSTTTINTSLSISDAAIETDSPANAAIDVASVPDTTAGADTTVGKVAISPAISDNAASTDLSATVATRANVVGDTASGTDAPVALLVLQTAVPDNAAGSESLVSSGIISMVVNDTGAGSDVVVAAGVSGISIADAAAVQDGASLLLGQINIPSTSMVAALGLRGAVDHTGQVTLAPSVLVPASGAAILDVSIPDTAAQSELVVSRRGVTAAISDSGSGSDTSASTSAFLMQVADSPVSSDAVVSIIKMNYTLVDVAASVDSVPSAGGQTTIAAAQMIAVLGLRISGDRPGQVIGTTSYASALGLRNSSDRPGQTLPASSMGPSLGTRAIYDSASDGAAATDSSTTTRSINMSVRDTGGSADVLPISPKVNMSAAVPDTAGAADAIGAVNRYTVGIVDTGAVVDGAAISGALRLAAIAQLTTACIYEPVSGKSGGYIVFPSAAFQDASRDDDFLGSILAATWIPTLVGGGQYTVNNDLVLTTSTAVGSAVTLLSALSYAAADLSIRFELDEHVNAANPTAGVDYVIMRLACNVNNFIQVSRRYNTTRAQHTLEWSARVAGVDLLGSVVPTSLGVGYIRLIVAGNIAYGLVGDDAGGWQLVGLTAGWLGSTMQLSIGAASAQGGEPTQTIISRLRSSVGVLFGQIPAIHNDIVGAYVRSTIPGQPKGNLGTVVIQVFNHNGIVGQDLGSFIYTDTQVLEIPENGPGDIDLVGAGALTGSKPPTI